MVGLLFAFVAVLVISAVRAPDFFQRAQLLSMLCDAVPVLIAACGMTLVILCRQIDISTGSQFALCSVFAGLAASNNWLMPLVGIVAPSAERSWSLQRSFGGILLRDPIHCRGHWQPW